MVDSTWKITQGNPGLPWVITIFCNGGFHHWWCMLLHHMHLELLESPTPYSPPGRAPSHAPRTSGVPAGTRRQDSCNHMQWIRIPALAHEELGFLQPHMMIQDSCKHTRWIRIPSITHDESGFLQSHTMNQDSCNRTWRIRIPAFTHEESRFLQQHMMNQDSCKHTW